MLELIFIINSFGFPASLMVATYLARKKRRFTSISEFVRYPHSPLRFLKIVLILGNLIQLIFSLYLFINYSFPNFILLSTIAGSIGIIVSFIRIDKHFKLHIGLTIVSLLLYTTSLLLTSLILNQSILILISLIQILLIGICFAVRLKVKNLEIIYFILFGARNLIIITQLHK